MELPDNLIRSIFQPMTSGAVLSKHDNYLDAEDAALRRWLHKSHNDDENVAALKIS
jgi:hypothetical protein